MKSLQDAVYNWLTIKVVADERPDDQAAKETERMFYQMLIDEHGVKKVKWEKDESMYFVSVETDSRSRKFRFPVEIVESMLNQIKNEPEKYQNYQVEEE